MTRRKRKAQQPLKQPLLPPKGHRWGWRWVSLLAVAGVGLSSYLTYTYLQGSGAAFCPQGSGCHIVQTSPYARLFQVPVALIGAMGYAAIFAISLSRQRPWLPLYLLTLGSFAFSSYLTYIELFTLRAVCFYCLVSLGIIAALLGLVVYLRPLGQRLRSPGLAGLSVLVIAVVVSTSLLSPVTAKQEPAGGFATDLAQHLTATRAKMYGTYWCPYCQKQKALFGDAVKYVTYVECDPRGAKAQPQLCQEKGIQGYPTWEIGGKLSEGLLSLEELARLSGFLP